MAIEHALHGHLVATVFEVILTDAGYHVIPTGIEQNIRELRPLEVDGYLALAPTRLRSVPDFFVLDLDDAWGSLTEVKFRRNMHPGLFKDLQVIQHAWAPFILILALAEPPEEWTGEVRHIKVFEIESRTCLDEQFLRHECQRIQDVFDRLTKRWEDKTILKAEEAILRLSS